MQVEDVLGYIDFIKKKIGIVEQESLSEAMKELAKQVPPTVLGSINRTHAQIRSIAEKLLNLHNKKFEYQDVKKIITSLTEKLYSHQHHINRNEARDIVGLNSVICSASDDEEKVINSLYYEIKKTMNLNFDLFRLLTPEQITSDPLIVKRAYIKSMGMENSFSSEYIVKKLTNPDGSSGLNIDLQKEGWDI